jgi:hypothetical protein
VRPRWRARARAAADVGAVVAVVAAPPSDPAPADRALRCLVPVGVATVGNGDASDVLPVVGLGGVDPGIRVSPPATRTTNTATVPPSMARVPFPGSGSSPSSQSHHFRMA